MTNKKRSTTMKKNSFWDIIRNYVRFHNVVAGLILIVVLILILGKVIFNWITN